MTCSLVKKSMIQFSILACALLLTSGVASASSQETCDRSLQSFCAGDRVISYSLKVGSVLQVFKSNRLLIQFDNQIRAEILSPSQVNQSVSCSGQICRGQQVTNFMNQTGQVVEVFSSGWVRIYLSAEQTVVLRKISEISIAP